MIGMAALPIHLIKRHPIPIEAHFDFVLVLTFALPQDVLTPLLAPGLEIDSFGDLGFVAIAFVQTQNLRPLGWPRLVSQNFFLVGHRVFARFRTREGRRLRGLRILRSDANRPLMVFFGNMLTHYNYHLVRVDVNKESRKLDLQVRSEDGNSDVKLVADLDAGEDYLPEGSPFATVCDARKFAGPLPFTFDYEAQTDSIVRVEGVRQNWHPKPAKVEIERLEFLQQEPFVSAKPVLCSAFYIENIPYHWKRGIVEKLSHARTEVSPEDEAAMDGDDY